jgi:hypothetical protein
MIDELEVQRYDKMFGTKSKCFPETNKIVISTFLDEWVIEITGKRNRPVCLYHKNLKGKNNKFHRQGYRRNLYQAYDSIYSHKNWMPIICRHNIG